MSKPEFRMTKYFQNYLKSEFYAQRPETTDLKTWNKHYFAWLPLCSISLVKGAQ